MSALLTPAHIAQAAARASLSSPTATRFVFSATPSEESSPSSSFHLVADSPAPLRARGPSSTRSISSSVFGPRTSWTYLSTVGLTTSLHAAAAATPPPHTPIWHLLRTRTHAQLHALRARLEASPDPDPPLLAEYVARRVLPALRHRWTQGGTLLRAWTNEFPGLVGLVGMGVGFRLFGPSEVGFARVAQTAALFALPTFVRARPRPLPAPTDKAPAPTPRAWLRTANLAFEALFLPLALARSPLLLGTLAQDVLIALPRAVLAATARALGRAVSGMVRHRGSLGAKGGLAQAAAVVVGGAVFVAAGALWDWMRGGTDVASTQGDSDGESDAQAHEDWEQLSSGLDGRETSSPQYGAAEHQLVLSTYAAATAHSRDHRHTATNAPALAPAAAAQVEAGAQSMSSSSLTLTPARAAARTDSDSGSSSGSHASTDSLMHLLLDSSAGGSGADSGRPTAATRQHLVDVWLDHVQRA